MVFWVRGSDLKRWSSINCLMSRGEDCACSSWGSQKNSFSSPVSYRGVGGTSICFCEEVTVLKVGMLTGRVRYG